MVIQEIETDCYLFYHPNHLEEFYHFSKASCMRNVIFLPLKAGNKSIYCAAGEGIVALRKRD